MKKNAFIVKIKMVVLMTKLISIKKKKKKKSVNYMKISGKKKKK